MNKPGPEAGRKSGCPFCLAMKPYVPKARTRIKILTDFRAGRRGTVVQTPATLPLRPGEILVKMDDDEPGHTQIVSLERELIEPLPEHPIPLWAPPISLKEAANLERIVVKFCEESDWDRSPNWQLYYALIGHVWKRRLPLDHKEIWAILKAHGVPDNWKNRLVKLYQEGRDMLIYLHGLKPVKKKRVSPLS